MISVFFWWATIQVVGFAALPFTLFIFKNLHDRGYFFSKILGLLLVGYFSWVIGFFYDGWSTTVIALLCVAGLSLWRFLQDKEHIQVFFENNKRYIIITELLFAALLVVFCYVRMHDPDIHSTEKPMDFALLNAVNLSKSFPPHDPWMAGQKLYISYYYFGYVILSVLNKLSGLDSAIVYNLAVAALFAYAGVAAFSLGFNFTRRYTFAGIALVLTVILGNLEGVLEYFYAHGVFSEAVWKWLHLAWDSWDSPNGMFHPTQHIVSGIVPTENWWWWRATRVITHTINEFPFFSFLMADLHPHVIALPFTLLMLALCLNVIKDQQKGFHLLDSDKESMSMLGVLVITVGAFGFLNAWDFPTYLLLLATCLLLKRYFNEKNLNKAILQEWGVVSCVITVASIALYFPFYFNFHSQAKGIGFVTERTDFHQFLIIFGTFLWIFAAALVIKWLQFYQEWKLKIAAKPVTTQAGPAYCPSCGTKVKDQKKFCGQCGTEIPKTAVIVKDVVLEVFRPLQQWWLIQLEKPFLQPNNLWLTLLGIVVVLAGFSWVHFTTALFLLILLAVAVFLVCSRYYTREEGFAWLLMAFGALLTFGCEFIHITDGFAGLPRMNTVFKFYYESWVFWALAGTYGLYIIYNQAWRFKGFFLRYLWSGVMVCCFASALLYTVMAVYNKSNAFSLPHPTLDGTAYLKAAYPADYDAVQWIKNNVKGYGKPPVILEVYGEEYWWDYCRVSSITGFPTVLGWKGHEMQWRGDKVGTEVNVRAQDVDTIYNSHDIAQVKQILNKYEVDYVYIGYMERIGSNLKGPYDGGGLAKFHDFMDVAYENFGVTIYKMR